MSLLNHQWSHLGQALLHCQSSIVPYRLRVVSHTLSEIEVAHDNDPELLHKFEDA